MERNWRVVGLTEDNYVVVEINGEWRTTEERPSAYIDVEYLTRSERGILRKGLTAQSNDRARPG